MAALKRNPGNLVFGLDIGTRSVVGTVGYRANDRFHVIAQEMKQHDTRSMLDGQIHDIEKVGRTIADVKDELERKIGKQLNEVCIAAAGRVLKTVTAEAEISYDDDVIIDAEQMYTLDMLGIEKAYEEFHESNDTDMKFYCVGYTVVKYLVNGYPMTAPEKHKARKFAVQLIATFLPDDVVDGLYKAVEIADLTVANLTLEPIAAMQAAVPDKFRMLNIALVDVGAGTSDISITKDGSIIAYGMISKAGDEITEAIAHALLIDFATAEYVKVKAGDNETIEYEDIMGIPHTIEPDEVYKLAANVVDEMTSEIAGKITELNGGKPVSAVFVVGGGGKIDKFTDLLAAKLSIINERVALRGREVLKDIDYQIDNPMIDSMFVTPVGICLNFYDQKNNFIFVNFNGKRIKLYDNGHLTVADAAMQANFPNDGLFPKRGRELRFTVNGRQQLIKGQLGEPAAILLNDKEVSLNSPIIAGDKIKIKASTAGADAHADIKDLSQFAGTLNVIVNERRVSLPQLAEVNGNIQADYYSICQDDEIRMLNYYTVKQLADFMDVTLTHDVNIYVNNKTAAPATRIYDNFSVIWSAETLALSDVKQNADIEIYVNDEKVVMKGRTEYSLVNIFDYIDFDLSKPQGKSVVTKVNGVNALVSQKLNPQDRIEIYWEQ